jgi:hypothetical protein
VEDLKETIRKLEENQERDQELKRNVSSIKMTGTTDGTKQIDVEVKVGNETIMADHRLRRRCGLRQREMVR